MKQGWEIRPFEKCIEKVKYTTKIATCDYSTMGVYPVISQEEEYISGYWNNAEDVFKVSKPVVIFGDHTRVLKYVDFDFVLGADGVKILQPIDVIDAKFFLYYLIASKIPSLGYSRHYKLLKELNVPVPPISEQEKIVAELDCLSGIIEKKKQQLKELDALAQSIFYEMFGDPIENDKGWEVKKLGDMCSLKAGKAIKASELSDVPSSELYPCFGGNGIRGYIAKVSHHRKYPIIGRQGALCGNVVLSTDEFYATEHAVVVQPLVEMSTYWLYYTLKYMNLNRLAQGVAQPGLSVGRVVQEDLQIIPLTLQQDFASKIESIEKQKELIAQSIKETETLFNSRMDYYFN